MSLNIGREVIGYVDEIMEDAIGFHNAIIETHVKDEQIIAFTFTRAELLIDMAIWNPIRTATRL